MASTAAVIEPSTLSPVHRFTTDDYLRMIDAGILGPGDRVELINGVIVNMSPSGPKHNGILMRLTELLYECRNGAKVMVQSTLVVGPGQVFDPDLALLQPQPHDYIASLPTASDVLLLIEVAESSLQKDQRVKMPVYAQAGIPEYWIVDLEGRTLIVHRNPRGDEYGDVVTYKGNDTASPLARPGMKVQVSVLFA